MWNNEGFPHFWIETKIEWTCWGWCMDMLLICIYVCVYFISKNWYRVWDVLRAHSNWMGFRFKEFVCMLCLFEIVYCFIYRCTRDYCQMHSCAFSVDIWNNVGVGQQYNRLLCKVIVIDNRRELHLFKIRVDVVCTSHYE